MGQQGLHRVAVALGRCVLLAAGAALFPFSLGAAATPASPPPCALTLSTGQPVDFAKFRGQVLYVDFWASWCGPCLLSFPFMNALRRDYGDKGLHVLAIDMDEKPADATHFLDQHKATFDIANGPNGQCAKDFGVAAMPTSFLIDRSGVIRAVHQGFRPGDIDDLKSKLEELIAENAAEPGAK
jgi:thiol-disulfide isomerase/thioredoxin